MSKIYKLAIFVSFLTLAFVIGNLGSAQTGYFLEKGKDFYIFDNLYINGYLTVGRDNLSKSANFGDLLVSKNFTMDSGSSLVFCKDERQTGSNLPLNRDCANKILIWSTDSTKGLRAVNPLFTRIKVDKIEASSQITLKSNPLDPAAPTPWVLASGGTRVINGCFSKEGSSCSTGDLKTDTIYLQSLRYLNFDTGGRIIVSGPNFKLGEVDLGRLEYYPRHGICWVGDSYSGIAGCGPGKSSFNHGNFVDVNKDHTGATPARADYPVNEAFDLYDGSVLCCFINPLF